MNFGVLLPYSRTQEQEADAIGLGLMAKAGYDPAEAVEVWRRMQAANLGEIPAFLSDHPSNESRIEDLRKNLAAHGRTVLISSHLISEIAQTADQLIVIGQGRLLAQTTVA